jgi:hypothetical protein
MQKESPELLHFAKLYTLPTCQALSSLEIGHANVWKKLSRYPEASPFPPKFVVTCSRGALFVAGFFSGRWSVNTPV